MKSTVINDNTSFTLNNLPLLPFLHPLSSLGVHIASAYFLPSSLYFSSSSRSPRRRPAHITILTFDSIP
ncbi:hypothetical protein PFISCL1PPCAC_18316, partial [Pristionchus fissidentatus]